jgi:hypothetical protein
LTILPRTIVYTPAREAIIQGTTVVNERGGEDRRDSIGRPNLAVQTQPARKPQRKQRHPLAQTRLAGDRKREEWLTEVAGQSSKEGWSREQAKIEVLKAAAKALIARHITTEKSHEIVVSEGLLAARPEVRDHVPRLISLRDEAWNKDPNFLRAALHGPSQMLVDLMRRQRRPNERHHAATVDAYLAYLRRRMAA